MKDFDRTDPANRDLYDDRAYKIINADRATDTYVLDMERIAEEEKYDGFYAIATNLYDDAKEIIAISEKRNEIEDCFRVMKTNFSARPIYHRTRDRIKAHFLICYTALLIYRLMEIKLNDYGKSLKPKEEHYTTDQIIETLRNLQVADVNGMYYLATYQGSQVLDTLNGVFQMDLDKKYYLPKELNKKIKKISH